VQLKLSRRRAPRRSRCAHSVAGLDSEKALVQCFCCCSPRSPAAVAPRASSRRPDGAKCACLLRTGSASKRHCASVEMEAWGLSIASLNPQILLESTIGILRRIAANGPIVVRQTKQAIYRGIQMSLWDGSAFEIDAYNRLVSTEDRRRGAGVQRRPKAKHPGGPKL
jgi:hypothetical protein